VERARRIGKGRRDGGRGRERTRREEGRRGGRERRDGEPRSERGEKGAGQEERGPRGRE